MDDASPAKWHLAHTTWFFETFVLRDHVPGYHAFDDRFAYLFNSYYEAEGPRHARPRRGLLTRPSLETVLEWRGQVDDALITALPTLPERVHDLVTLGMAHEQQHQELMLTDLLALFADFELSPSGSAGISVERIERVCGRDWGWWRTATETLRVIEARWRAERSDADAETGRILDVGLERVGQLRAVLAASPRSIGWRVRSMIGPRVRWYDLPEDVRSPSQGEADPRPAGP